jgi:hypothetical protein
VKRRTVARGIALVLLAYVTALVLVAIDKDEIRTYQSLSREAMLAKLAGVHNASFDGSFLGSFVVLGAIVLCANGLTTVVEWAIDRISPPPLPESTAQRMANARDSHGG